MFGFAARAKTKAPEQSPQTKKDQLALVQSYSARPGPDDPGGLGAEESGIERTGPTQVILIAIWRGTPWAEVGRYYD